MTEESRHQVNLLDLLALVLRWRKAILIAVLSVSVVTAVISFMVTPRYSSIANVRAAESSGNSLGSLISSKLASLGGIGGFAPAGLGELPGQLFITILKGRETGEKVVEKFNLRDRFKMKDAPIEEVLKVLSGITDFEREVQSNTIWIEVQSTDPVLARDMAAFYVEQLDTRLQAMNTSRAEREREFIGGRLDEARAELAALEDSMNAFQLKTGVLDIEEQVKATVQAAAALKAQRLLTQAELELNTQIFDPGSPEIRMIEMKLAGFDSSLVTLIRKREAGQEPDFLVPLMDSPELGMIYLRLVREIEIHNLLVLYLTQQFEQQRIESIRNTPTLHVIQNPAVATLRVWPKRGLMVGIAAFGTLVFVLILALIVEFFRAASQNPDHPQHERIVRLRSGASS